MRNFLRGTAALCCSVFLTLTHAADYPMTVVDGLGTEITLQQAPQKIASLTLFTDEIFVDLLEHKRLSHITNLASDNTYSNIADRLPQGVKQTELNVEVLVADYPDIIFAANWSEAPKIEQLRQAGLNVYLVNTPNTLDGIQAEILKLGTLLDAEAQAQAIVEQMNAKLAQAKAEIRYPTMTALDYNTWGTASGKHSTYNAIITAAGLTNSVAEFEADAYGQVPMSKELIVEINPQVLFLPGFVWGDPEGAETFKQQIVADAAIADVDAIVNQRIVQIPESLRGTFSQYIADSVLYVVEQLNAQP